jgi:hypothetical protein
MRKLGSVLLILVSLSIPSCSTSTPLATPQVVSVYSTAAAEPWLSALYDCAQASPVLSRVDDPFTAEIVLRVGEPKLLSSFAYQIDTEEILIVTHRQSPVSNLTIEEARALFSGHGDPSVQVWSYASGVDVREVFDQFVMKGRAVTSSAFLVATPQQMSDTLVNEPNTIGILPAHWKVGDSRVVYTISNTPVLAITQNEPQGSIKSLIGCLQK